MYVAALVALLSAYPTITADIVAAAILSDSYSIGVKLQLLSCLAGAAFELADVKSSDSRSDPGRCHDGLRVHLLGDTLFII